VKPITISIIFCVLFLFIYGCETGAKKAKSVKLETTMDSVSYIIGTDMAQSLANIKDEINVDILVGGMEDQLNERPLKVSKEDGQTIMRDFSMRMQKKMEEERKVSAASNTEEGKKFLEENKKKEGVETTESGLQYIALKKGDGPKPAATDKVKVHYKGTTIDGTEFDSSHKRGEPAVFNINGVIKGWTEALLLMNVGSKYKLFVPPELAYGERGAGAQIGPNAVLIFEVELLGIEK
jgi:FKBP-type peptidyl-prolyl cis-trans isomerase